MNVLYKAVVVWEGGDAAQSRSFMYAGCFSPLSVKGELDPRWSQSRRIAVLAPICYR